MDIRNELLEQILVAIGGADTEGLTRNQLLKLIVLEVGGDSSFQTRNELLEEYLRVVSL